MRRSFRVRKNAASLKHVAVASYTRGDAPFPRSKERGLIEADGYYGASAVGAFPFRVRKNAASLKPHRRARLPIETHAFPRSKERGLIEANAWSGSKTVSASFRVRKNAASLKPIPGPGGPVIPRSDFPRSKERGLIEAPPLPGRCSAAYPFPRSKERGLMKPGIWGKDSDGDDAFRVRKNAASLKPFLQ